MSDEIYLCPTCRSSEVRVIAEVCVKPLRDGVEAIGDIAWNPGSSASCEACEWSGLAGELVDTEEENA